jgi:hypothetical protein
MNKLNKIWGMLLVFLGLRSGAKPASRTIPVVVSRAFAGVGQVFVHDDRLTDKDIEWIAPLFKKCAESRAWGKFLEPHSSGKWLLGAVSSDALPLDPRAANRQPVIVRAAVLDFEPLEHEKCGLLTQLLMITPTEARPTTRTLQINNPRFRA